MALNPKNRFVVILPDGNKRTYFSSRECANDLNISVSCVVLAHRRMRLNGYATFGESNRFYGYGKVKYTMFPMSYSQR